MLYQILIFVRPAFRRLFYPFDIPLTCGMAYGEKLATRIRERLEGLKKVEEKQMMGGLTFMYKGKCALEFSGTGFYVASTLL